jgi:hypothetical protein
LIGLGLKVAVGGAPASDPAGDNSNLLTATEELDSVAWTATDSIVTNSGAAGPDAMTAYSDPEEVSSTGAGAALRQVSGTSAATGSAATQPISFNSSFQRFFVTGTFDSAPYTFSIYIRDASGGDGSLALTLRLDRSGGFLRVSIEDPGGVEIYQAWGAQL